MNIEGTQAHISLQNRKILNINQVRLGIKRLFLCKIYKVADVKKMFPDIFSFKGGGEEYLNYKPT